MAKKWYSFFVVTDEAQAASPGAAAASTGPEPAPRRASELVPEPPAAESVLAASAGPVDLSVVYDSAKISAPAHGYTVLKVAEMLSSEHLRDLPADVKRKSIMVALDAAGVTVDEIVEDAVRRDRALDTYERVLQQHVTDLDAAIAAENARIEEEIARQAATLRARIEENSRKLAAENAELLAWRTRKHQEEAAIAEAVGYFVTENPITRASGGVKDKGDVNVR